MTLISRLEQAEAGSRELSCTLAKEIGWKPQAGELGADTSSPWAWCPNFTESIDAAMSLVPEGWTAQITQYPNGKGNAVLSEWSPPCRNAKSIGDATPALALVIASLKAAGYE